MQPLGLSARCPVLLLAAPRAAASPWHPLRPLPHTPPGGLRDLDISLNWFHSLPRSLADATSLRRLVLWCGFTSVGWGWSGETFAVVGVGLPELP